MKKLIITFVLALLTVPIFAQTYLEEPARVSPTDAYVTTYATLCNTYTRSFTFRYNAQNRISYWVAYPLNAGLIGTGSRGEGWLPDPALPEAVQASLYKGFKYGSGYDRGHQIPSADRLDPTPNEQTFRFTNATPQLHDFNGGLWAELEKVVRNWSKRCDTLYVVTGVIPGDKYIDDNVGNPVNVPSVYYKAVLRYFKNKNGYVFWTPCAIVLEHKNYPVGTWKENLALFREKSVSLEELEVLTKEQFFPLLEKIVGTEEFKKIKKTQPRNQELWWM